MIIYTQYMSIILYFCHKGTGFCEVDTPGPGHDEFETTRLKWTHPHNTAPTGIDATILGFNIGLQTLAQRSTAFINTILAKLPAV